MALVAVLLPSTVRAATPNLPAALTPAAPFPAIVAQSFATDFVAPGVRFARYRIATLDGPLVVTALAVDPRVPTVRIDSALADDRLSSPGETVAAMAARTGAVGGINGDFFDIGHTGQPLGIVIRAGQLLRSPDRRAAIVVGADGAARFGPVTFAGQASDGSSIWPLTAVDRFPPQGGVSLILPSYGPIPPAPGVTLALLQATPGAPQGYSVVQLVDATAGSPASLALAFGPAVLAIAPLPAVGDPIQLSETIDPPIAGAVAAVGGGPLYLRGGQPATDPAPPSPGEALRREPLSGVLARGDGALVFVEVDGHDPTASVGLTRPEFSALLAAFGAVDAMGLDGGGSSTLVARTGGADHAVTQNVPSDGRDRPVADGLFVYSSAAGGPPARLALRPDRLDLLTGAFEPLIVTATDAAGNPLGSPPRPLTGESVPAGLARLESDGMVVGLRPGTGTLAVRSGALVAELPLTVAAAPAAVRIEPAHPNPNPGESLTLRVTGFDRAGDPVALPGPVVWTAAGGTIAPDGRFEAGNRDAVVAARVAGVRVATTVLVGRRTEPLPVFGRSDAAHWRFDTYPRDRAGELTVDGGLALDYDFTGDERAAYARTHLTLAGLPLALGLTVDGDRSGVGVRAALVDARGAKIAVTLAKRVDWEGPRPLTVTLPARLVPPIELEALYVVGSLGGAPVHSAGTLTLRDLHATFAGSQPPQPLYHW
ncbi:MAG: phosphodiester glycosidase family protein [Vulcanimicrobiaceae bacterium]